MLNLTQKPKQQEIKLKASLERKEFINGRRNVQSHSLESKNNL